MSTPNITTVINNLLHHHPLGLNDAAVDALAHSPFEVVLDLLDPHWAVPTTHIGDLATSSEVTPGVFPNGSGGSVHDFLSQTHDELAMSLSVIHRQGNDYTPTSIDSSGVAHYNVAAGAQVVNPAAGVFTAAPTRAEWSLNFDISTKANGGSETLQQELTHRDIEVIVRQNNQIVFDGHVKYDPAHATASSPVTIVDPVHGTAVLDMTGSLQVAANSENNAFTGFHLAGYTQGDATFNIEMKATDLGTHHVVEDLQAVVVVGQGDPGHHAFV